MALVAVFATSCSDDNDPTYLDGLRVSTSFVSIPEEGGSADLTFQANSDWYITCCDTCKLFNHDHMAKGKATNYLSWLNIDKLSGQAGENTVKFSADKYLGGHAGVVYLHCGDEVQNIKITQGTIAVTEATCKEVTEGPDGKLYRVTGTCKNIYNTEYGNWHLDDGTADITIYGTLDAKGATKNFKSLGIEEGDIVTVEGPKQLYGETVELVDVTVINIQKSLLKVDSVSCDTIALEGGDLTAFVTCKGDGLSVEIPKADHGWLSILSVTGGTNSTVKFHATANPEGIRTSEVTLKTTKNGKEYVKVLTIVQLGSLYVVRPDTVNVTVDEFLKYPVNDIQHYQMTGVIDRVANTSYGNFYLKDYTGETYVYGIGKKGDFEKLGLKVGDIVTLIGTRAAFNGTPQVGNGSYVTHISVTPVTIAEFIEKPKDKNTYYMVSGTITSLKDNKGNDNDYGNLYLSDGTNQLYVYGCYPGWGATGDFRKGFIKAAGIEVGDRLTMIGYKDVYNDLIELCGGVYFSHEKLEK